jgi:hypothetical protein
MRVLLLTLLAACELQPAPKKQAEPPPPPPAAQVEAAKPVESPPPVAADAGAGSAAKIEITAPCLETAAKLAQLFIDLQKDPGAKSNAEQARGDMTRKMGEACSAELERRGARVLPRREVRSRHSRVREEVPAAAASEPATARSSAESHGAGESHRA